MGSSCRKILAFLMSFALLFSIAAVPAVAADSENRTVTLGFENVEWHTEDNETYCSADITASLSTDDATFDAMIIQFNVIYNTVPGVLAFDAVTASDTIEKVTSGTGRNQKTSTMTVDSIDAETADSLGYASVLMHGDNGVRHPIKNGQVIATAYFLLADNSMKNSESQLSFSKGVINYIDDSPEHKIQNYSVNTDATAKVPALVPSINAQELNTVTLNPSEITVGQNEQTVQASAMDKENKPVTAGIVWSLDRTEGVSVSNMGVITVTSTASGNYIVTASPAEGTETVMGTAQATLKVNPLPVVQELNTVTLNPSEITSGKNEQTVQASAIDKDNKPVTAGIVWSLDRTEGVSVSDVGVITVTSAASGNYVVTASPAEGSETVTGTAQATLKVNSLPVVQELNTVTLNLSEITAGQNEQTVQASAMDKDNKPVTAGIAWSLDRTEGVSVSNAGVITVKSTASGNYVVTASPTEGSETVTGTAQATLKINPLPVVQELNTVTLNPSEITAGQNEQTVQASAMDKDNKPVTAGIVWSLDRTEGVSVSNAGVITVTSTASGNYVVTASPAEGSETVTGTAQATLKVNPLPVVQELNTVALNPVEITADENEQTVQASAVDKENKPVTTGIVWSLDRTEGVNISNAGVITVTSTASGNYVVTASPTEGSETVTGTAQATLKVNPFNAGYAIFVSGGSVQNPSKNGKYPINTQVTIKASIGSFSYWTGLDNISFINGDENTATVTFYMPDRDVNAVAHDGGCYVATAVYGSYDCPEVWTLRRFRDEVLARTWYGRLFIRLYYAVSPTAVKLFGGCEWFQNFFRERLDKMVSGLQADGFESTPYQDRAW